MNVVLLEILGNPTIIILVVAAIFLIVWRQQAAATGEGAGPE